MARSLSLLLLACAAVLLSLLPSVVLPASAMHVVVRSKDAVCFSERVGRNEKVVGTYVVLAGGSLDIDMRVLGPDGKVVFERERTTDGSFTFKAVAEGMHSLCFDNKMSSVTSKTVGFELFVGNALASRDAASASALSPLESSVVHTSEGLHAIRNGIQYAKTRVERHARTVNSTNNRVVGCSVINCLALIIVAAAQVGVIRNMFEKRRSK